MEYKVIYKSGEESKSKSVEANSAYDAMVSVMSMDGVDSIEDAYREIYLNRLDVENYDHDGRPFSVGKQTLFYTCEAFYDDAYGISWRYVVTVEANGNEATRESVQRGEGDSAYHSGFAPAYKSACNALGVEPLIDE